MDTLIVGRIWAFLPTLLALLSAFVVITLGLWFTDVSVQKVFSAFLMGAAGDQYRLAETLVKTCPLLYTGLAVVFSVRAGIWNIGAEGQFLLGALAVAWASQYSVPLPPIFALLFTWAAAMLAGGTWAAIVATLKQRRGVNEVLSTIMLNFVAAAFVSYCVHGPLMEVGARYPQTDLVPLAARLPRLLPPTRLHLGVLLALPTALGVWFLLFRTKVGFTLRATGANPIAARFAGIQVERQWWIALVLSGALAGLGGGIEVSGVTHRVYEKFSPGYGYTAIAVALVGQQSPLGVVPAALFFGALEAGSGAMQRAAGVSSALVSVIQAIVVCFLALYSTDAVRHLFLRKNQGLR